MPGYYVLATTYSLSPRSSFRSSTTRGSSRGESSPIDVDLDICEIETNRLTSEPGRADGRTDGRMCMSHIFRVYYFVGGWSREVRSAVLVADSISRVHAPLNAVVLRKEVVDFTLRLSLSLSLSLSVSLSRSLASSLALSLSLSLSLSLLSLLFPVCSLSLFPLLPFIPFPIDMPFSLWAFGLSMSFTFLSFVEKRTRKGRVEKEDRILLRCCDMLYVAYVRIDREKGYFRSCESVYHRIPTPGRHSSPWSNP